MKGGRQVRCEKSAEKHSPANLRHHRQRPRIVVDCRPEERTASLAAHFYTHVGALWIVLAIVRLALVFVPQTGYIHPDEFFQSTEVVTGDIFGLKTHRTWEFSGDYRLRNVAATYLTSGIPLWILKLLWSCVATPGAVPSPYLLLLVPRLFACLASFTSDYAVFHLSTPLSERRARRIKAVLLFASSHVAIVFYTRTFGNSVESWLLTLLLLCVNSVVRDGERKWKHAGLKLPCTSIAAIISIGTFNRPTFIIFALPAVLGLLFSAIEHGANIKEAQRFRHVGRVSVKRAAKIASRCLMFSATLVFVDTYYYHPEIFSCRMLTDPGCFRPVFTPLNFIRYNLNASSLKSHGIHPNYVHMVINIPLLFNVLGFAALWTSSKILYTWSISHVVSRPDRRETFTVSKSFDPIVAGCVLLPTCVLSLHKHQEQRYLVPLLVPMVLAAHRYFSKKLLHVWVVANVVCLLFFGFFHQGGLVPCLFRVQQQLASHVNDGRQTVVIFAHTYMPPRHLLTVKRDNSNVHIMDLMGTDLKGQELVEYIVGASDAYWKYLVAPALLSGFNGKPRRAAAEQQFTCGFHFSGEHLPQCSYQDYRNGKVSLSDLRKMFSLAVYRIKFVSNVSVTEVDQTCIG